MKNLKITILAFVLVISSCQEAIFNLFYVKDSEAKCLDGSPGALYVSEDGDPKKILLRFKGGGWCGDNTLTSTLQSCYQRSKTELGSSLFYPKSVRYTDGSLSKNDKNNFKDWKKIYLMYCDGAGHQGSRKLPIEFKNTKLYFRGHNISVAQLQLVNDLTNIFSQAEKVVVAGDSAGGLAVYFWANYIRQRVQKAQVWAVPDSGIFLDSQNVKTKTHNYKISFKNLMLLSNTQVDPPVPQCIKKFPTAKQNCMFAQNLYMHLKVPQFAIQSLYDTWSIRYILGITCVQDLRTASLLGCSEQQRKVIEQYHLNLTKILGKIGEGNQNGFWAPICADHIYSTTENYYNQFYRIPQNTQFSARKCVEQWLQRSSQNNQHIDEAQWPQNRPCSGIM